MSLPKTNVDLADAQSETTGPHFSDMRRVSMALAFAPARHDRRRHMRSANNWFRTKLGIGWRRTSRG